MLASLRKFSIPDEPLHQKECRKFHTANWNISKLNVVHKCRFSAYFVSLMIAMSCLEKPQRGAFRSPFMNIISGALLISAVKRSFRVCPVAAALLALSASFLDLLVMAATSTPSTRSTAEPLLKNITVGTASIWKYVLYRHLYTSGVQISLPDVSLIYQGIFQHLA